MKLTKVEEARDAALAARDQLSALRREELTQVQRDAYQRMRGLWPLFLHRPDKSRLSITV